MTQDILLWAAVSAVVACTLLALTILLRDRARLRRELQAQQTDVERLRSRVDGLVAARAPHHVEAPEYVITDLGELDHGFEPFETVAPRPPQEPTGAARRPQPTVERIDGRLFADIVLRETVVKAAALTHGVRRALAPEVVWRVRGEVRRELKRARRQRKADLKTARREFESRRRAQMGDVA